MSQTRRSQRFVCLASVMVLLTGASPAFAITVEEIPNPRPNRWSVDLTGTIPAESLQQIDHFGDEIRAANGAEIAVVVIDSTNGVPSRDFAKSLFDQWKIGESDEDNGFLILAAMTDRKVEIVLGQGLNTPANNQASAEIMQGDIVPLLRAGDPGGALLAGTRAAARRILGVEPPVAETATPVLPLAETAPPIQSPAERAIASPPVADTPHRSAPMGSGCVYVAVGLLLVGGFCLRKLFPSGGDRTSYTTPSSRLVETRNDDSNLWSSSSSDSSSLASAGFMASISSFDDSGSTSDSSSCDSSSSDSGSSGYSGGESSDGGASGSW